MNAFLLSWVMCIYLWVAVGYFADGRIGMGVAFIAYALANGGFILDWWGK